MLHFTCREASWGLWVKHKLSYGIKIEKKKIKSKQALLNILCWIAVLTIFTINLCFVVIHIHAKSYLVQTYTIFLFNEMCLLAFISKSQFEPAGFNPCLSPVKCRRQLISQVSSQIQKIQIFTANFKFSMKMHLNEYKQVQYWLSSSWGSPGHFEEI